MPMNRAYCSARLLVGILKPHSYVSMVFPLVDKCIIDFQISTYFLGSMSIKSLEKQSK